MNRVLLLLLLFTNFVFSQTGSSLTSTASVTLIRPITLREVNTLNFGTIIRNGSGTVKLTPTGRVSTGGVGLSNLGDAATCGTIEVSGLDNAMYVVTLPENGITIYNGDSSLVINDLTITYENSTSLGMGTLNSMGIDRFKIGGTLTINDVSPFGTYTGTFTINVDYN